MNYNLLAIVHWPCERNLRQIERLLERQTVTSKDYELNELGWKEVENIRRQRGVRSYKKRKDEVDNE